MDSDVFTYPDALDLFVAIYLARLVVNSREEEFAKRT
jgi:hypothetical protein